MAAATSQWRTDPTAEEEAHLSALANDFRQHVLASSDRHPSFVNPEEGLAALGALRKRGPLYLQRDGRSNSARGTSDDGSLAE